MTEAAESFAVTERTRVRRKANRAVYDKATLYAIIDEAIVASVAVVIDGQAHVQPMIHVRIGDAIILHGIAGNRLLTALCDGQEACLNVTLVDALVLARRIEDHSLHYRSVTWYARAQPIEDLAEKAQAMRAVFESLVRSQRYDALPPLDPNYLKGTMVLRLPIAECVGKINCNAATEAGDGDPIWSGTVPFAWQAGTPQPDGLTAEQGLATPGSLTAYRRGAPA